MNKEFSDTDAELARCIKSRMRFEMGGLPNRAESKDAVRNFMLELVKEIISEEF